MQRHERSFSAFRLSPTPPTRLDQGSSRAKNALLARNDAREERVAREERAEHRAANRVSSAIQQYSLTPTASGKSTKTIKSTRPTIRRTTRKIQSKKSPVQKGRFRLAESDCVRNGLADSCTFDEVWRSHRSHYHQSSAQKVQSPPQYRVLTLHYSTIQWDTHCKTTP